MGISMRGTGVHRETKGIPLEVTRVIGMSKDIPKKGAGVHEMTKGIPEGRICKRNHWDV